MAAYPSYSIGLGSTRAPESGWLDDISDAGTMHSRQMHGSQYYRFQIVHPGLSGQQYADLLATYAAGPRDTYTGFTYHTESPALTYSVQFTTPPETTTNHGGDVYDVTVQLRGWVA